MSDLNNKTLVNRFLYRKALIFLSLILCIFMFIKSPLASSLVRTNSSLLNIEWGMSPEQVLYATKEYSRDAEFVEDGDNAVLTQRERITDSDIAAKSEVLYSFKNGRIYNIKIRKTIKYRPDFILEQLLYKMISDYEVENAYKILIKGNIYQTENTYEHKVIFLGYDGVNNPKYAYVELKAKI